MSETTLKRQPSLQFSAELVAYAKQRSNAQRTQLEVNQWKASWLGRLLEKLIGED